MAKRCPRCSCRITPYNVHISEEPEKALCPVCFLELREPCDYEPFAINGEAEPPGLEALVVLHGFHVCGAARRCLERAEHLQAKGFRVTALAVRGGGLWSEKFESVFDELIFLRSTKSVVPIWLMERLERFAEIEAHYQPAITWCRRNLPNAKLSAWFHTQPLGLYDDETLLEDLIVSSSGIYFPTEAARLAYRSIVTLGNVARFDLLSSVNAHTAPYLERAPTRRYEELCRLAPPGTRVGILTRLDNDKFSPTLFLDAATQIIAALPEVMFVVAGPGEESYGIREMIGSLGQEAEDHFIFTGYIDDVQDVYTWADIMFLPSWTEVLPYTVLEAADFGKHTVAPMVFGGTSPPEIPALIGFDPGDARGAADLILVALRAVRMANEK